MDIQFRQEFPLKDGLYYLNHAAVSPWPKRTVDAVKAFAEENLTHGATHYPDWLEKEAFLRKQLKKLINAKSINEIALLKNTSEAISVVAEGMQWGKQDNVVSSNQEFPSNRVPWLAQAKHQVEFREVDLDNDTSPEDALISACDECTRVLTISSVQYSTGLKMNLKKLGEFCRSHNILFCVDAIQSLGAHSIDVTDSRIDFLMADAHKWMMGPEGIAVFYCRDECLKELELRQFGWHMLQNPGNYDETDWQAADSARRFECGSPNMMGIHALSASLSLILDYQIENIEEKIREKTQYLLDSLRAMGCSLITPESDKRRAGIITVAVPNNNMQELQQLLMSKNVICAYRGGGIRFSPHFYTEDKIIKKALDIFKLII